MGPPLGARQSAPSHQTASTQGQTSWKSCEFPHFTPTHSTCRSTCSQFAQLTSSKRTCTVHAFSFPPRITGSTRLPFLVNGLQGQLQTSAKRDCVDSDRQAIRFFSVFKFTVFIINTSSLAQRQLVRRLWQKPAVRIERQPRLRLCVE